MRATLEKIVRSPAIVLLLIPLAASPAFGAPPVVPRPAPHSVMAQQPFQAGPTSVEAVEIAYDQATGIVTASGDVRVTHPSFRLFAQMLTFDTRTEMAEAQGNVRLVDAQRREIRAERLVYDVRAQRVVAVNGEAVQEFTHLRARELEARPGLITAREATVTTCDPARPLYRVTAQRVEIVPGRELVAYGASLWLGNWRVITLPVYRMSLRPGEAGPSIPRFGYNRDDGYWIDYTYDYDFGSLPGSLHLKYGQRSGIFASNRLTTLGGPQWVLSAGRSQTQDPDTGAFRNFNHVELGANHTMRFGGLPVSWSGRAAGGWFEEAATGISTNRVEALVAATTDTFRLSEKLTFRAAAFYRLSAYATGNQRHIIGGQLGFTYQLGPVTTAVLSYSLADVRGSTPFLFDAVTPTSLVGLAVYYGPEAYQLSVGVGHDFAIPKTLVSAGAAVRISPSLLIGAVGSYNLTGRIFEDIDYTVGYRCDCLTVALRYRQVRQELWLEVALRGVSQGLSLFPP